MDCASYAELAPLLEEATQSEQGSVGEATVLLDLEGWDSMGMVMFIAWVEERFGVELSVHDLRECESAGRLAECVARKLKERA